MRDFPCLMCKCFHPFGECTLMTERIAIDLPEWLDKRLRERVPKGQRAAFMRRLLEEALR